jgi:hypothetical protein
MIIGYEETTATEIDQKVRILSKMNRRNWRFR